VTLDAVVHLYAPEAVLVRRLLGRAAQSGRSDDNASVIRRRLDVFTTTTSPLIAYYRDRGILLAIDADQPPDAVTAEILARLSDVSLNREKT
jgi:adenylate kinase